MSWPHIRTPCRLLARQARPPRAGPQRPLKDPHPSPRVWPGQAPASGPLAVERENEQETVKSDGRLTPEVSEVLSGADAV